MRCLPEHVTRPFQLSKQCDSVGLNLMGAKVSHILNSLEIMNLTKFPNLVYVKQLMTMTVFSEFVRLEKLLNTVLRSEAVLMSLQQSLHEEIRGMVVVKVVKPPSEIFCVDCIVDFFPLAHKTPRLTYPTHEL